jgi:hypothetical protein
MEVAVNASRCRLRAKCAAKQRGIGKMDGMRDVVKVYDVMCVSELGCWVRVRRRVSV